MNADEFSIDGIPVSGMTTDRFVIKPDTHVGPRGVYKAADICDQNTKMKKIIRDLLNWIETGISDGTILVLPKDILALLDREREKC